MEDDRLIQDARVVHNEPLVAAHDLSRFDCGNEALNDFLRRRALSAPRQGLSQTWVTVDARSEVLAYFTLTAATFDRLDAPARVSKGAPAYPIPAILLARMAVDRTVQGQGLGRMVMESALRKVLMLGRVPLLADGTPGLPMRAVMVHAKDERIAGFHARFGFEKSPTDPLLLFLLLKDIERSLTPNPSA